MILRVCVAFACIGVVPTLAWAQAEAGRSAGVSGGDFKQGEKSTVTPDLTAVDEFAGPGGLRVLMQPAEGVPEVSVCTSVGAGSRWDPSDSVGAHRLLAEMLRDGGYGNGHQGSGRVIEERGGRNELIFERDVVTYCATVPAAELPVALWAAGGRFSRHNLAESNLKAAVDRLAVLAEETDADLRMGRTRTRLRQMAFLGTREFSHPDLPNASELDHLDLDTLRELHDETYVANRSTLSIVGGFEPRVAEKLVQQHMTTVRAGKRRQSGPTKLVRQTTARFSMSVDKTAKTPAAWYGWVAPADATERRALELALTTLVMQPRLGGKVLGGQRAAKELDVHLDAVDGPGLFQLEVIGRGSRSLGIFEKHLDAEIRALQNRAPTADEVARAQTLLRERRAEALTTASGRARELARGVVRGQEAAGVLAPLGTTPDAEIGGESVRLAALSYLDRDVRNTIEIYPKGWQDPWQVPMRRYHVVSKGETLGSIARQYGTTVPVITKMNGVSQKKTIYPGDKLRVPRGKAQKKEREPRYHKVRRGDTLGALALKYGVSSRSIAAANGMNVKQPIRTGEKLRIPWSTKASSKGSSGSSKTPSSKGGPASTAKTPAKTHVVKSGETLGGIALKYGVRVSSLARLNGLSTKSMVRIGQKLAIPTDAASRRKGAVQYTTYSVKKGDTLGGIAKKNGSTVTEIEKANGISRKKSLRIGQKLKIPKK